MGCYCGPTRVGIQVRIDSLKLWCAEKSPGPFIMWQMLPRSVASDNLRMGTRNMAQFQTCQLPSTVRNLQAQLRTGIILPCSLHQRMSGSPGMRTGDQGLLHFCSTKVSGIYMVHLWHFKKENIKKVRIQDLMGFPGDSVVKKSS